MGTLILYFDLTIAWATTEAEVDGVVGGDGAKLVFTGLFFGPAASVLLAFVGTVVHFLQRFGVLFRVQSEAEMPSPIPTHSKQLDNPYCPPSTPIRGG
ncbi:MAG: hypothetical protein ABL921_34005 [Pirellula sp.]